MRKVKLCIAVLFLFVSNAYAQGVSRDTAERIIVSEAADQGLKGMICVAEVLRHRNSPKGFSTHIRHQSKAVWQMAAKAWDLSATTDYTRGADHFENVHSFGRPWWLRHCVKTYQYKDHIFYREISKK